MRAGPGLGVVLDRGAGDVEQRQAFDRPADRIGPVQHPHRFAVFRGRLQKVTQRRDERIDPATEILQIDENDVDIGHEATVSKIGEEQLFYLMSRGLSEAEASAMIVSGFVEPITKELPLEYAVEMNRLVQLQMEGSVG